MARGDKPGHRVIFWTFIAVLLFIGVSLAKAGITSDDCDHVSGGKKAWVIFPPDWECGAEGRIKFTSD